MLLPKNEPYGAAELALVADSITRASTNSIAFVARFGVWRSNLGGQAGLKKMGLCRKRHFEPEQGCKLHIAYTLMFGAHTPYPWPLFAPPPPFPRRGVALLCPDECTPVSAALRCDICHFFSLPPPPPFAIPFPCGGWVRGVTSPTRARVSAAASAVPPSSLSNRLPLLPESNPALQQVACAGGGVCRWRHDPPIHTSMHGTPQNVGGGSTEPGPNPPPPPQHQAAPLTPFQLTNQCALVKQHTD